MRRKGLQHWLETGAKGPAFAVVAVCMIMRAASAYSGGAFSLPRLLPSWGLALFDMVTGIGLAVGAELLASIAGRAARRHHEDGAEAAMQPGLKKWERELRIELAQRKTVTNQLFSVGGLCASIYGAFWFLWNANPLHTLPTILAEVATTAILVGIVYYLGVISEDVPDDPRELAQADTAQMNLRLLHEAGKRIAAGTQTRQDIAIYAENLPRMQRSRFRAIMAQEGPDDPPWGTAQIVGWLTSTGANADMVRKRVSRALRAAEERGHDVRRDERGAYQLPRSLAFQLFAADFLELAGKPDIAETLPRPRRRSGPALALTVDASTATETGPRHTQDTPLVSVLTPNGIV